MLEALAILLALGFRTFLYEPYRIPSAGTYPTLAVGDHVFVAKSAYLPLSKRTPRRGDLIVFRYPDPDPTHAATDYVKRVVALPGDVLSLENGHPRINGWLVPSCRVGSIALPDSAESGAELYVEFLEDRAYLVVITRASASTRQGPYKVPAGEIYVLGDNRDNSSDSRAWRDGKGAGVPLENVYGRASVIYLPGARTGISLTSAPVLPEAASDLNDELAACLGNAPDLAKTTPPKPPRK